MPLDDAIRGYYDRGAEQGRLASSGRLEAIRTREVLERHLPASADIIDVGGGPGAYAHWLAEAGHRVHLVDPVPLHVQQALSAPGQSLAGAVVGDARDLPFPDACADVVLLLGPLYHLTEAADRARALTEAWRVLRPGGFVVAAMISRYASTVDGLFAGFLRDPAFERIVEGDLRDGRHVNPGLHPGWFTTAYFHLPDELHREVAAAGFAVGPPVAIESVGAWLPDLDAWLDDPASLQSLLRAIRRVETDPALLGVSAHVVVVGRR